LPEQRHAVGSRPRRIGGGEMLTQITQTGYRQQGVGHRMSQDITV
jgi:hypothetical protein